MRVVASIRRGISGFTISLPSTADFAAVELNFIFGLKIKGTFDKGTLRQSNLWDTEGRFYLSTGSLLHVRSQVTFSKDQGKVETIISCINFKRGSLKVKLKQQ
jgi:hypothetical protein